MTRLISTEKLAKEINGITAPIANKLIPKRMDTIYYRRQVEPEKIHLVLQAHDEGSSLRGVSRTTLVSL